MVLNQDESKIHNLTQYVEFVENLPKEYCVSRGHNKKSYVLLPSALRLDAEGNRKYSKRNISYFMDTFKVNCHNFLSTPWDVKNDIEWMAMAQHYGLPTRLLDFTDSHIISLMFAVENAFDELDDDSEDAEVWFLNPIELNNINSKISKYINIEEPLICAKLDEYDGPVAIKCRKLNDRINAQSGLFVYFSDSDNKLDEYDKNNDILKKVIIDKEDKKGILASLYAMGINRSKIYPELASVAKDILINDNIREYIKGVME